MSNKTHPGIGYAHPHYVGNVAGQTDQTNVHADLGKAPLPKRAFTEAPEIHSGMNAKSRDGKTHFSGLSGQDLSCYDGDGPDPLSGAPRGKRLTPVQPVPGMRSRTNENQPLVPLADQAKAIMDEAGDAADIQTKRALGIGTLPPVVTEE